MLSLNNSTRLNIFEINRKIEEKERKINISHEKVLEKCHKQIINSANESNLRTLIELPEHIYGYPLYDLNNCIKFVISSLNNDGFYVKYFFPKILYVSWDFNEIKENKKTDIIKVKINKK